MWSRFEANDWLRHILHVVLLMWSTVSFPGIVASCRCGTYCALGSLENPVICPIGSYCPEGTLNPVQCPVGSYCPLEGLCQSLPCPCGTYTSVANATSCTPCPQGTFNSQTGSSAKDACAACPAGGYCPSLSVCVPVVCPCGAVCPVGSVLPVWCTNGTYSDGTFDSCHDCPIGTACGFAECSPVMCPCGHYCPNTTSVVPCPNGTFSSVPGTINIIQCLQCPDDYWCGAGSCGWGRCPPGKYCPSPDVVFPCPPGTFSNYAFPSSSATGCVPCPDGYYCRGNGTISPSRLPCGTYATTVPAIEAVPCMKGYWRAEWSLDSLSCDVCPAGFTCNDKCKPQPCEGGFYCPLGAPKSPLQCPGGSTSQPGAASCTMCPGGTYCSGGTSDPEPCPAGRYCPVNTTSPLVCPDGTYGDSEQRDACKPCPAGKRENVTHMDCIDCPCGHYCPLGKGAVPCPTGTMRSNGGGTDLSSCAPCEAGTYCVDEGLCAYQALCPVGMYCPGGVPQYCPLHTYNPYQASTTNASCLACSSVLYCPLGSSLSEPGCPCGALCSTSIFYNDSTAVCDAGFYFGVDNPTSTTVQCLVCPAGYVCPAGIGCSPTLCGCGVYCPPGSASSIACRSGTYQPLSGASRAEQCIPCTVGQLCDEGSCQPSRCRCGGYCPSGVEYKLCPNATYNDREGGSTRSSCRPCPSGKYCPAGTCTPNLCDYGNFCPAGVASPIACPRRTFAPRQGLSRCLDCPPEKYCPSDGMSYALDCTCGEFCPGNTSTKVQCDGGYFNSVSTEPCQECPAGSSCYRGACRGVICQPGTYCPALAISPIPCPPGTTMNAEGATACTPCNGTESSGLSCMLPGLTQPQPCPCGMYCPTEQTIAMCPNGTYTTRPGVTRVNECLPCPGGSYCDGTTFADVTTGQCLNGTVCPKGHYCPRGASRPIGCPGGTFNNDTGSAGVSSCKVCSAGYYCSPNSTLPVQCSNSTYCPANSSAPSVCPPGQYTTDARRCVAAPAGQYCGSAGCKQCSCGSHCPGGTADPIPCIAGSYAANSSLSACVPCPPSYYCPNETCTPIACPCGSYCPKGSPSPTPCPPLTYDDSGWLASAEECIDFPEGSFVALIGQCIMGTFRCPCGAYCPLHATQPLWCPDGTFNPHEGMTTSASCTPCSTNTTTTTTGGAAALCSGEGLCATFTECPCGAFCSTSNSTPLPTLQWCSKGTYGTSSNAARTEDCYPCRDGQDCSSEGTCGVSPCPCGAYCVRGIKTLCPVGTFNPRVGSSSSLDCQPCPSKSVCLEEGRCTSSTCPCGHFCPINVTVVVPCREGTYSFNDSTECLPCIKGSYCPPASCAPVTCPCGHSCPRDGLYIPQPCPAGTYSPRGQVSCTLCQAGEYCPNITQCTVAHCPCGYYCPTGTSAEPCPGNGTYSPVQGAAAATDCQSAGCPVGSYCPEGSCAPVVCPKGSYCPTVSLDSDLYCDDGMFSATLGSSSCSPCSPGTYCPLGTVVPEPCPCGMYCPGGAPSVMCPWGTFSNTTNATSNATCLPCDTGANCSTNPATCGVTATNCACGHECGGGYVGSPTPPGTYRNSSMIMSSICPKGFACPQGTCTPKKCEGERCLEGTSVPVACEAGTFGNEESGACDPCPPGTYCPRKSKAPQNCPCGYYCPDVATATQCPFGTFTQRDFHARNISDCLSCDVGMRLVLQGACVVMATACPCGSYCPGGPDFAPIDCPAGTFNSLEGQTNKSSCTLCKSGDLCPPRSCAPQSCECGKFCFPKAIEATSCPAGTYSPTTQASSLDDCLACPPGSYCPSAAACSPVLCPCGSYCPQRWSFPLPCPVGTYNALEGQVNESSCQPCRSQSGSYCGSAACSPGVCGCGFYCPTSGMRIPCPIGTYGNKSNSSDLSVCVTCPVGYYCPSASCAPTSCPVGYFCPQEGASEPTPCTAGTFSENETQIACRKCPNGTECPWPGMAAPWTCQLYQYCDDGIQAKNCPNGTYSNATGAAQATDCGECPAGYYCRWDSVLNVTAKIDCPCGAYCPAGLRSQPQWCPPGTFNNVTRQASIDSCLICPPGSLCANEGACNAGVLCPAGGYCRKNASTVTRCPPGTFSAATGQTNSSACAFCEAGSYCPNATFMEVCPCGTYCPQGSLAPTACPLGTYSAALGANSVASCLTCVSGSYCPPGSCSMTSCPCGSFCPTHAVIKTTPQGYYSMISALVPTRCPSGFDCTAEGLCYPEVCPAGSYCPSPTSTIICPRGFYCPERSRAPTRCTLSERCVDIGLRAPMTPSRSISYSTGAASATVHDGTTLLQTSRRQPATAGLVAVVGSIFDSGVVSVWAIQSTSQLIKQHSRCNVAGGSNISEADQPASPPPMSDFIDNLFLLHIDSFGETLAYAGGSVVSGVLVCVVIILIRHLVTQVMMPVIAGGENSPAKWNIFQHLWEHPGQVYLPITVVLLTETSACITLAASAERSSATVAVAAAMVVCLMVLLTFLVGNVLRLHRWAPDITAIKTVMSSNGHEGIFRNCVNVVSTPQWQWCATTKYGLAHLSKFEEILAKYRSARHWFCVIEIGFCVLNGAINGALNVLPLVTLCEEEALLMAIVAQLVLNAVLMLCAMLLSPFANVSDGIWLIVQTIWTIASEILLLADANGNNSSTDIINALLLAQSMSFILPALPKMIRALVSWSRPTASLVVPLECLQITTTETPHSNLERLVRQCCALQSLRRESPRATPRRLGVRQLRVLQSLIVASCHPRGGQVPPTPQLAVER